MSKLICGVGLNDVSEPTQFIVDGKKKRCVFYTRWCEMLKRCYSEKLQSTRYKSYVGCSVTSEWHLFSNFKEWMISQDWEGKQLDKDILFKGNRVYSPETCVFVDSMTNTFMHENEKNRGHHPLGVKYVKSENLYYARVSIDSHSTHIGCYKTAEDAHHAWYIAKRALAISLAERQTDERVSKAILARYP